MLRYSLFCFLFAACLGLGAAPVPKAPAPKALTADMMVGTWQYEWDIFRDGVIAFDAAGGYVGIHIPGSSTIYSGTWKIEGGDTIVISEYAHSLDTNARWGPTEFRFTFDPKTYPNLVGKSNGTKHVAIRRAKP